MTRPIVAFRNAFSSREIMKSTSLSSAQALTSPSSKSGSLDSSANSVSSAPTGGTAALRRYGWHDGASCESRSDQNLTSKPNYVSDWRPTGWTKDLTTRMLVSIFQACKASCLVDSRQLRAILGTRSASAICLSAKAPGMKASGHAFRFCSRCAAE